MVRAPAAPGVQGGRLAEWGCLSCQKQTKGKNKVSLALEESYRKKTSKENKRTTKVSILGVQLLVIISDMGRKIQREKTALWHHRSQGQ